MLIPIHVLLSTVVYVNIFDMVQIRIYIICKTKGYSDLIMSWSPLPSIDEKPINAIFKTIYSDHWISIYTLWATHVFHFLNILTYDITEYLLHYFACLKINIDLRKCTKSIIVNINIWKVLWQNQVSRTGTIDYILQYLWDVITCPCPWYLLLKQNWSYEYHTTCDSITFSARRSYCDQPHLNS